MSAPMPCSIISGDRRMAGESMHHRAVIGDVENPRDAPDAHGKSHGASEFDDLGVGEGFAHPVEELGSHFEMIEREPFGELNGQALALRKVGVFSVTTDLGVLLFSECVLRSRRSPSSQSNVAVVDLCEAHSSHLDHIDPERAVFVHCVAEGADGSTHSWHHLPQSGALGPCTGRNVDVCHLGISLQSASLRRVVRRERSREVRWPESCARPVAGFRASGDRDSQSDNRNRREGE